MKRIKIIPSESALTSITIEGIPHHYFHSEKLGRCRAILIPESENLPVMLTMQKPEKPMSKGQKLDRMMNTSERLGKRIQRYLDNWRNASDYESKIFWREKLRAAEKADSRVIRKMAEMLGAD